MVVLAQSPEQLFLSSGDDQHPNTRGTPNGAMRRWVVRKVPERFKGVRTAIADQLPDRVYCLHRLGTLDGRKVIRREAPDGPSVVVDQPTACIHAHIRVGVCGEPA